MFKQLLGLLLIFSAILVLYPMITSLNEVVNAINSSGYDNSVLVTARNNAEMQIVGFVLLYIFAGLVLAWLPEHSNSEHLQDCPNCGKVSLSKVHMNVNEISDANNASLEVGNCLLTLSTALIARRYGLMVKK